MRFRAPVAAVAAAALTVITATSAFADVVTNDLDTVADTTHELMQLTLPGSPATTELRIIEQDQPDHPNCNIPGAPHFLQLIPSSFDSNVIAVEFPDGLIFNDCDDLRRVVVTPVGIGSTTVSFTYVAEVPSSQGHARTFSVEQADFDVVVTASGTGGGEICDADPAAPAWAAALLKGNGVKPKGKNAPNYVAMVAHAMGPRATFGGFDKTQHSSYEDAVRNYMEAELGISLAKGPRHPDVVRPGWECTQLPTL